ncbi:MAG: hypothetical protein ACOCWM_00075 [Cyclobacteriaceae bacterium]
MDNQKERFAKHYRVLGILYIVYGIINLLIITFSFYAVDTIFRLLEVDQEAITIIHAIGYPLGIAIAIICILLVLAGATVNPYREGSKIFILILGCLIVFSFPLGTILGVYAIVTYVSEHNEKPVA